MDQNPPEAPMPRLPIRDTVKILALSVALLAAYNSAELMRTEVGKK